MRRTRETSMDDAFGWMMLVIAVVCICVGANAMAEFQKINVVKEVCEIQTGRTCGKN